MRRFIEGEDRTQITLLPECLVKRSTSVNVERKLWCLRVGIEYRRETRTNPSFRRGPDGCVPGFVPGIRIGVGAGTCKAVADSVHPLKSAARSIGALRLAAICDEMEVSADAGRPAELVAQLASFEQEYADVHRFLDASATYAVAPPSTDSETPVM